MGLRAVLALILVSVLPAQDSLADEPAAGAPEANESRAAPEQPASAPSRSESSRKKPAQKQKRPREKEAEGTEAADRFEADTVIKSRYQLNGESLEVDPD